ncbi:MAG: glycoside hydrolase family 57 protein [Burkholderiales bacterium]
MHGTRLEVVLLWHMHQPDYRDYATGEFTLPWVYLHALKDYSDMAAYLEMHPGMHAVVNFVPILLDQIEDYAEQLTSGNLRDPLLRLLAREDLDHLTDAERRLVLDSCWHANHVRMIEPFPVYRTLKQIFSLVEAQGEGALTYLSGQYLADLLTWYHLVWTGETVRRGNALVPQLLSKAERFTYADRCALLDLIRDTICGLIPRYRRLAESGRVELSSTPHFHPLGPLLVDFSAARDALPEATLPISPCYPGGRGRLAFHIASAIESHSARFGCAPTGIWPAEGAVSQPVLEELARHGVRWIATGEGVLGNSLRRSGREVGSKIESLYRPWRVNGAGGDVACFFRDDRLSDLIGFEYCRWHGSDAAGHFVGELEAIARSADGREIPIVSVILDGENAWEFYPYNGYYFLTELYHRLETHPFIRTTTFGKWLDAPPSHDRARAATGELSSLAAGSWVYGNLSTWIGATEKNHAWDLLAQAKQSYDLVMASGRLTERQQAAASLQLASCESSDWFWWFGDYNPAHSVASFDRLFRQSLTHLYRLLQLPVPEALGHPISVGGGTPEAGGAMRRSS